MLCFGHLLTLSGIKYKISKSVTLTLVIGMGGGDDE